MYERPRRPAAGPYPDLAATGGLPQSLARAAAARGYVVRHTGPVEGYAAEVATRCTSGEAWFAVYATSQDEREFRIEISTETGRPWGAFGSTDDLAVVAALLDQWCEGASAEQLRDAWPMLAERPGTGPAVEGGRTG
ncbi:hypothetical protein ABT160_18850 [Streptomyces sp. NPDC001941]|uniref:hypothetical protein n=1 Tax=Streptomyces sp. NPDC001941 TaxID=3154659 RepID=UPI0033251C68